MCPAFPAQTNSLPHASANRRARLNDTAGSFRLATTIDRNGSRSSGIGAKLSVAKDRPAPQCRWGPPGEHHAPSFGADATNGPPVRRQCYAPQTRNLLSRRRQLHPVCEPNRHSEEQTSHPGSPPGTRDALPPRCFARVPGQSSPTPEESGPSQSPFSVTAILHGSHYAELLKYTCVCAQNLRSMEVQR